MGSVEQEAGCARWHQDAHYQWVLINPQLKAGGPSATPTIRGQKCYDRGPPDKAASPARRTLPLSTKRGYLIRDDMMCFLRDSHLPGSLNTCTQSRSHRICQVVDKMSISRPASTGIGGSIDKPRSKASGRRSLRWSGLPVNYSRTVERVGAPGALFCRGLTEGQVDDMHDSKIYE